MTPSGTIRDKFEQLRSESTDLYQFLNAFRDWVNASIVNYEVYLEDNWFEEKTTIEYIFRCLSTFNILVFAEDHYNNYRADGVWNLGEYVTTQWVVGDPWDEIVTFFEANEPPRFKNDSISD